MVGESSNYWTILNKNQNASTTRRMGKFVFHSFTAASTISQLKQLGASFLPSNSCTSSTTTSAGHIDRNDVDIGSIWACGVKTLVWSCVDLVELINRIEAWEAGSWCWAWGKRSLRRQKRSSQSHWGNCVPCVSLLRLADVFHNVLWL